jgi:tetratricopeptide (TPR) repeat protein
MGNSLSKSRYVVSAGLKGMYYRVKAELNDVQDLYLSAIECYQELLDTKLYQDEKDHSDILIRLHRLYKSSGQAEQSMAVLEKADLVNSSAKPRNMLMFLRVKLLLINNLETNQINRALDIAERTLNDIKKIELSREEKQKELLIRNRYIQLLMKGAQYEKALTEQKVLTHMVLDANGEESIKITLNQIQHAQILNALGKQNGSISLFRKTLHNKRFREHLRNPVFEKKLKSLLETFDKQSQAKLIANCRDLEKHIECA